jgi:hypothetical protein
MSSGELRDSRLVSEIARPGGSRIRLQAATADRLNALYADLLTTGRRDAQPLTARSVRYTHAILRKALEDAVRWQLVARNTADRADPPRQDRNREAMRTWTTEQLRRLLVHVEADRLYRSGLCSVRPGCDEARRSDSGGTTSTSTLLAWPSGAT